MKQLIAALLLAASLFAWAGNASPESDRDKAIRFTHALEQRPLDKEAPQMRAWLIQWAEAAPDVSILVCDVLGPIPGTQVPYGPELLGQSMFGNGVFQLQHPESSGDVQKTQMAGITSLLVAYQSLIQTDPDARIPHFDVWLTKQAAGTLASDLAPLIQEKCSDSSSKA